jgi:SAM-dependent methyltransferase
MHPSSKQNMKAAREYVPEPWRHGDVIDVGAGRGGEYLAIWKDCASYRTVDIEGECDLLMPSPYKIPLISSSIDVVISGQTLEHVQNPFKLVTEMRRVLKPLGFLVLIAPSAGPAHFKVDFWRFGRDSFKGIASADECQLEVVADWIHTGPSGRGPDKQWNDHVFVGRKPA